MSITNIIILLLTATSLSLLIKVILTVRQQHCLQNTIQENAAKLLQLQQQQQQDIIAFTSVEQSLHHQKILLDKAESSNNLLQQQDTQQNKEITRLQTELKLTEKSHIEKLSLLEDAKTKMHHEFKELANKIFEEKQRHMTSASQDSLNLIIKPMQRDISEFKMRMEQVHKEDIEARSALAQHLQHLQQLNQKMSQDALNLTQALKGDSKAQGNWGEMILEKLLESSGLREGYEFEREKSFVNDEGKRQRPDVIIRMPGDKQVIIDAKVSLTDYERAMSSRDDKQRQQFMRAHMKSIQTHIQTLSHKRYEHLEGLHSPDYVLMFMPIEAAYLMAIEIDSSIFEAAFDQRIAVVTPSTLYATLKLIEQLWRYERQSENIAKLTKQAGNLHDKFVGFIESFEDIQIHIGRAQKSYDKAVGQLKDGRGNLINQVKTLADLSGKAKKEIPKHLLSENFDV